MSSAEGSGEGGASCGSQPDRGPPKGRNLVPIADKEGSDEGRRTESGLCAERTLGAKLHERVGHVSAHLRSCSQNGFSTKSSSHWVFMLCPPPVCPAVCATRMSRKGRLKRWHANVVACRGGTQPGLSASLAGKIALSASHGCLCRFPGAKPRQPSSCAPIHPFFEGGFGPYCRFSEQV